MKATVRDTRAMIGTGLGGAIGAVLVVAIWGNTGIGGLSVVFTALGAAAGLATALRAGRARG